MVTRMDFLGERLIKAELGENPQIRKRIQDVVKEEVKVALEEREEIEKRALNLLVVNIIIIFHTVRGHFFSVLRTGLYASSPEPHECHGNGNGQANIECYISLPLAPSSSPLPPYAFPSPLISPPPPHPPPPPPTPRPPPPPHPPH